MSKPRCAMCATITVSNEGDVCADCRKKNQEAEQRLLDDLKDSDD